MPARKLAGSKATGDHPETRQAWRRGGRLPRALAMKLKLNGKKKTGGSRLPFSFSEFQRHSSFRSDPVY